MHEHNQGVDMHWSTCTSMLRGLATLTLRRRRLILARAKRQVDE